jgi:hypothetical protein
MALLMASLFWVKAFWTWSALTLVLKVGMDKLLTDKGAAVDEH